MSIAETDIVRPLESSSRPWERRSAARGARPWLSVISILVCVTAVAFAASGASPEAVAGRALLELLVVGVPLAAGLYALRSPATASYGIAMLAIGFTWSLTALAESGNGELYTIGRIATWFIFPGTMYLILAFPDGRVAPGLDRTLFYGVLALALVLFVGTVPLVAAFPPLTVWATCAADCPPNALFVLPRQPDFLTGVVIVREWLVIAIWAGLFVSIRLRWRAASPLHRRIVAPVFAAAVALGITHISFHIARQVGAPPQTVVDLSWVWALGVVAVCGAVLFGILWRRTLLSNALLRLGVALRASDRHPEVRAALSETLADPTLELLYRDPSTGVWHDASGEATTWPRPLAAHRTGTLLSDGPDDAQIVLIHDVALRDDPELLAAVGGIVLAGRRHEQLTADLAAANIELDESGRRVSQAADVERQRIQRDLHDGAQQRLVALRIRLGLAEDRLASDPVGGMRDLRELGTEVDTALEELRSLARGAFPAPLVDHGLVGALQALAVQSPLAVRVDANGVPRLPAELESAVYFTCAEALQNAVKHAAGATSVLITLARTSHDLRLEVRDDGAGFTPGTTTGHGLGNMRDRIGGVGGTLTVASAPGAGTSVVAV
ncbi:MAG TPA: histidine kinase, partial [Candidatus Limnocylindrales bacterium]|nr:histidine kinase [Candidatus Limnocylindrales bacterium]